MAHEHLQGDLLAGGRGRRGERECDERAEHCEVGVPDGDIVGPACLAAVTRTKWPAGNANAGRRRLGERRQLRRCFTGCSGACGKALSYCNYRGSLVSAMDGCKDSTQPIKGGKRCTALKQWCNAPKTGSGSQYYAVKKLCPHTCKTCGSASRLCKCRCSVGYSGDKCQASAPAPAPKWSTLLEPSIKTLLAKVLDGTVDGAMVGPAQFHPTMADKSKLERYEDGQVTCALKVCTSPDYWRANAEQMLNHCVAYSQAKRSCVAATKLCTVRDITLRLSGAPYTVTPAVKSACAACKSAYTGLMSPPALMIVGFGKSRKVKKAMTDPTDNSFNSYKVALIKGNSGFGRGCIDQYFVGGSAHTYTTYDVASAVEAVRAVETGKADVAFVRSDLMSAPA